MDSRKNHRIVITGGPGSGKSSLVAELSHRGFATVDEAGRDIIRDYQSIDGPALPYRDVSLFAELMFAHAIRMHSRTAASNQLVFFDRGIHDVVGFLRLHDRPVPSHIDRAASSLRYRTTVFIAPPWRQIYVNDDERTQTFEVAAQTHAAVERAYVDYGYEIVPLPTGTIQSRVDYVLRNI